MPTTFFDLPAELHIIIYELILVQDEDISFGNVSALLRPPRTTPALTNHLGPYCPLTHVSKRVRDETTPILFGRNTFHVLLSTHKHDGPLTQMIRQRRSTKTKSLFDDASASTAPGHLTYGDRNAAAWARNARPEALACIQRLTIEVEKADLVARWQHLRHLYKAPGGYQEPLGVFSPTRWYLHAIELRCWGLDTIVWTVDCKEKRIFCKEIQRVGPDWPSARQQPKSCERCRSMLLEWGVDREIEEGFNKEHFLGLIWYHGQ